MSENRTNEDQQEVLLKVEHLKKYFEIPGKGSLHAVDDLSFDIRKNETVGLVGESGCGKSTVGKVILKLEAPTDGKIYFEGEDITNVKGARKKELCTDIQMIFQDPYSSLNPRKTIRQILRDPLIFHHMAKGEELDKMVEQIATTAGLELYVLDKYPYELDGGKRQMVGIARALALNPKFIVCDEPVSALDVSVQATILNLLIDLQKQRGLSYLFVSHDLSVVRHISNRVAVMYLGQIVEFADTEEIFTNPTHPYTIALLSAIPKIDFDSDEKRIVLNGDVPSPLNPGKGCRFAPRCWMACDKCREEMPESKEIAPGHWAACHYWQETAARSQKLRKNSAAEEESHESNV